MGAVAVPGVPAYVSTVWIGMFAAFVISDTLGLKVGTGDPGALRRYVRVRIGVQAHADPAVRRVVHERDRRLPLGGGLFGW